jgi:hypothetical protein
MARLLQRLPSVKVLMKGLDRVSAPTGTDGLPRSSIKPGAIQYPPYVW